MAIIEALRDGQDLGFGLYFCPWMVRAEFRDGRWGAPRVERFENFSLDPAAKVLHYGQEIFEGQKAYRQADGKLAFFRPEMNIRRLQKSADILAIPPFPPDAYMSALHELTVRNEKLVPPEPGALYFRPAIIGTTPTLGVSPASDYLFYILASPVGAYFSGPKAGEGVSVLITTDHVRAVRGGLGAAKTGANYAASLRAVAESKKLGFDNVLFLDAFKREDLEELSGMNVFVLDNGTLKTPQLGDTVLDGITRNSLIQIASAQKIPVAETPIAVSSLISKITSGQVTEIFACGTGAGVTPIGVLGWKNERYRISDGRIGPVTQSLRNALLAIYFGRNVQDFPGWMVPVATKSS